MAPALASARRPVHSWISSRYLMSVTRRAFILKSGAVAAAAALGNPTVSSAGATPGGLSRDPVRPKRLREGDIVALVSPSGVTYEPVRVEIMEEILAAIGLRTVRAPHLTDRWGYLAGSDRDRASDLNQMFADSSVDGIFALHGGWGAARLLPLIDFDAIRDTPKVFLGFSDITALLIALYARSGLVTYHGPNGNSSWGPFTVDYLKRLLFDGEAVMMSNPSDPGEHLTQIEDRVRTISPGTARGRLVGGNLTVLTAIVGSEYLPDWTDHILFLEDTNEDVYRVDRMLTQLKLAGVLDRIAGFVFGKCTSCDPDSGYSSFTLEEVLMDHIRPLGVPAWHGAMIGHIRDKFTVPLGIEAEIDSERGTIQLLHSAVL